MMPTVRTGDIECAYEDDFLGVPWERDPEVVLMQAGYGANAAHFRAHVPGLAGRYRVLRRDAVGHGGTNAGDPDRDLSLEALAQDVITFLDVLGIQSVHYFGERTGGMTGIVLAALHPERVRSLAILGCPTRCGVALQEAMHAMLPENLRALYTGWNDAIRGLGGSFAWHDAVHWLEAPGDAARTAWQREQLHRCDEALLERYAAATLDFDVNEYLANVQAPTLIFAASNSYRTSLEDQLVLRRRIPHSQIEILEGSGGRIDDFPADRLTERMRAFLGSLGPS